MKCMREGCGNAGIWRPDLHYKSDKGNLQVLKMPVALCGTCKQVSQAADGDRVENWLPEDDLKNHHMIMGWAGEPDIDSARVVWAPLGH